jgi:hypothetical protein
MDGWAEGWPVLFVTSQRVLAIMATIAAHGTPRPLGEVAPHVPIGLRAIVMKAIDPDPAKRYATADELAAAIGARSRPTRTWTRNQPCKGHTTCFTGTKGRSQHLQGVRRPHWQPRAPRHRVPSNPCRHPGQPLVRVHSRSAHVQAQRLRQLG